MGGDDTEKQKLEVVPIVPAMMKLDVAVQAFDMQDISNRRFMYNPKSGILVLGQQYGKTRGLPGSHADDLAQAGIRNGFDNFVRGWVGTGKSYPAGVIHFAPNVDAQNVSLFNRAFDTLEMFQRNGALPDTVVRGFGRQWEQALSEALSPAYNKMISNQEESMEIQNITVEDLRRMEDKEGLGVDSLADLRKVDTVTLRQADFDRQVFELQEEKRKLYESLVSGGIPLPKYKEQKEQISERLLEVQNTKAVVMARLEAEQEERQHQRQQMDISRMLTESDGLTSELVDLLIDKIYVYPDKRVDVEFKIRDSLAAHK